MSSVAIQIDATGLFYRQFLVQQTTLGWLDARQVQTVRLEPGTYSIQVQSGIFTNFAFRVDAQGIVDYDAIYNGFVSGRGSSLLTLVGFEVTIDARGLSSTAGGGVLLASIPLQAEDWISLRTCRLLPQTMYLVQQGSGVVCDLSFGLGLDGTFNYEPATDIAAGGCLGGAGTSSLRLRGFALTVDVSAISNLLTLVEISGLAPSFAGRLSVSVLPAAGFRMQLDHEITAAAITVGRHGDVTLATLPELRLALEATPGGPLVRALPLAPPVPEPLVFATYDFGTFQIIVGSDASGPQRVSMELADGTLEWQVDRRWFPGNPTLTAQHTGDLAPEVAAPTADAGALIRRGRLSIALASARWPGTDVPADFTLHVDKVTTADGVEIIVLLDWAFGGGRFISDQTYDGNADAAVSVGVGVCPLGDGMSLSIGATGAAVSAQASFRPGRLKLTAASVARLVNGADTLLGNSLELTLLAPDQALFFDAGAAPPLHSRVVLEGSAPWPLAVPFTQTPVGELTPVADRFDELIAEVGENLDGRRRQLAVFNANSADRQFTLTLGPGAADAFGEPIALDVGRTAAAFNFDTRPPRVRLKAYASTADRWARTHGIGIRLGGLQLGSNLPNLVLESDGQLVTVPQFLLRYSGAAFGLEGCVLDPIGPGGNLNILPPGAVPDATLREWIVLGTPTGDTAPVVMRDPAFRVTRPADLLSLRFDLRGLVLRAGLGPRPTLGPADAGQAGALVVGFPPQHLVERTLTQNEVRDLSLPMECRLSGESRLVFDVAADSPAFELTIERLLSWAPLTLAVEPVCNDPSLRALPAPPRGLHDGGTPQASLELPYRLLLSPSSSAGFVHALQPVAKAAWTELWHTRLAARRAVATLPGGFLLDERHDPGNDAQRRLRAVWSFDSGGAAGTPPPELPFETALHASDRDDIVRNSASPPGTGYVPSPIEVDRLILSSQGGWLDSKVAFGADAPTALNQWAHAASMGRDARVRVVHRGVLCMFGHRASRVDYTERGFGGGAGNPSRLRKTVTIQVTEPVKFYTPSADFPFTRVEIRTLTIPIAGTELLPHPHASFRVRAWDTLGQLSEFTTLMVFLTDDEIAIPQTRSDVAAWYEQQADRQATLDGQKVALAPSSVAGDTTFEVQSITFSAVGKKRPGDPPPTFDLPVRPHLASTHVHLPAARALSSAGADEAVEIAFADAYLAAAGTFGSDNPGEVFAELLNPIGVGFKGDKSLGVVSPDMTIGALSRRFGTAPPSWATLFQPEGGPTPPTLDSFFPDSATLLGGIKLNEVVKHLEPPQLGNPSVPDVPGMKVDTHDPTQIVTTLDWAPTITPTTPPIEIGSPTVLALRFNAGTPSSLALHSRTVVRISPPGGPPPTGDTTDAITTGQLTNFDLAFMPIEPDQGLAIVHFAEFSFSVEKGRKPEVKLAFAGKALSLGGQLDFLQVLMEKLQGILGSGPSVKIDGGTIVAGYSIAIPQLSIGIFSLQNISVGAAVTIPLVGDASVLFRFNFAERAHPFNLTIGLLGGGGYFGLAVNSGGIDSIDLAVEAGASLTLDLAGLASGSAHVMIGLSFHYSAETAVEIGGYLRAGGELSVLQLISVHVEFYAGLTYIQARGVIHGSVSVMVEVTVAFLSVSVTLEMSREFKVGHDSSQAPRQALLAPAADSAAPITAAEIMDAAAWQRYAAAFA